MTNEEKTEYEDELVTSHSDESPELVGGRKGPLAAYSTEGPPAAALYEKQKEERKMFGYLPKDGEQVIDEEIYIPPTEE